MRQHINVVLNNQLEGNLIMKKSIYILASLLAASYISTANAGDISFTCLAGYACGMQVSYFDIAKDELRTWYSGSFPLGKTRKFINKDNQKVLAATAYVVFIGDIKIKLFTHLNPRVDYKGKMWGVVSNPHACLTEGGDHCV